MNLFDPERFLAVLHKRARGPAYKRRLARRLEERKHKHKDVKPYVPPTYTPPVPKSPAEIKSIRATRREKRIRRRIRQRQEMAARSGLPELERRSLAPQEAARRAAQAAAKAATTVVLPRSRGGPEATEEIDSNCFAVSGKNPNSPSQDHLRYG